MGTNFKPQKRQSIEERAWELRTTKCWTEQRIADELGTTQQSVHNALKRVGQRLAGEFKERAEDIKAAQTEQLEAILREALTAWERSQQQAESETVVTGRARVTKEGDLIRLPDEVSRTRKGQTGDAAFLAQAQNALAAIRDIWGLEAPKQQQVGGIEGNPIFFEGIDIERPKKKEDG